MFIVVYACVTDCIPQFNAKKKEFDGETELVLVTVFCAVPNSFCGSAQCSNKLFYLRFVRIQNSDLLPY